MSRAHIGRRRLDPARMPAHIWCNVRIFMLTCRQAVALRIFRTRLRERSCDAERTEGRKASGGRHRQCRADCEDRHGGGRGYQTQGTCEAQERPRGIEGACREADGRGAQRDCAEGCCSEVGVMPVPYSPLAIANTFISEFGRDNGIEHMKLQKLVYCSYGWWLAVRGLNGDRLTTEGPEIWRHGPVFYSLYHVMKIYGRKPIHEAQSVGPFVQPDRIDDEDHEVLSLVRWIWGRYGHLSSFALSDMTHKPGTPWHRVAQERNFRVPFNTEIPDEYIHQEFSNLLTENRAPEAGTDNNAVHA